MKGVVFTEFTGMVEDRFGIEMVDTLFEKTDLPSGGAYTAVGTYDHSEMVALVQTLSAETNASVNQLIQAFGSYLFGRFEQLYPVFFEGITSGYDFLGTIENRIHTEVRKLYPDAELPTIDCRQEGDDFVLLYKSERGLADLAHGLIEACLARFGDKATIERFDESGGTGRCVRFCLRSAKP